MNGAELAREMAREMIRDWEEHSVSFQQYTRMPWQGTITGRLPEMVDGPPPIRPMPRLYREMVVDGIPSSRVNAEGVSTNTHQPMVCIKDEEECGEYCGTCSSDVQYNKDYWASQEMRWKSQMHEFGVEWNPDIVF